MAARKSGSTTRAREKASGRAQRVRPATPREKRPVAKKNPTPKKRTQTKKSTTPKRRAPPRTKENKALRKLLKEIGGKELAKRLGKSERAVEGWKKRGVPKKSAGDVVTALERREAGKRGRKSKEERRSEEWKARRKELLAQKDSPITEAKQVVGVKLNVEGLVLGWGPGGILMRLYAVVSKLTGERRWFWTPAEYLAGFDDVQEFVEFYDIDPNEFELEMFFDDLLTEAERASGGLVF